MKVIGREVPMEITGLRPGEKLFEDLISPDENISPTSSNRINFVDSNVNSKITLNEVLSSIEFATAESDLDVLLERLS
jgi:FlaA1/EpsC-like NDP-sugar epimerase